MPTWWPVPTPHPDGDRAPSAGEVAFFRNFPHLRNNFTVVREATSAFNCHGWAVGFDDRWIDGGTPEQMERVFQYYFYRRTRTSDRSEVDMYMNSNAPEYIIRGTGNRRREIPNLRFNRVEHSHRNDHINAQGGCTSKMNRHILIRHDRDALEDNQANAAYGTIFAHYMRTSDHPTKEGKDGNKGKVPDHLPGPEDAMWEVPGVYPVGHPLIDEIAPPATGSEEEDHQDRARNQIKSKRAKVYRGWYHPYRPIPSPRSSAVQFIKSMAKHIDQKNPKLVDAFEHYFDGWKKSWFDKQSDAGRSPNSIDRTDNADFESLIKMGPVIVPLVVAKLYKQDNFMAVQLYLKLEKNKMYKVDRKDPVNYLVLQRHAQLIIDMNDGRRF